MSRVNIQDNNLVISMQGARKALTLKSELIIPLENVVSAVADPMAGKKFNKGWRLGTEIGFYSGGTFWKDGNKAFYDIARTEDAVVISLKDSDFDKLVIGVENPDATAKTIEEALK